MAIMKCKHCGEEIEATEQGLLVCPVCGGLQTAPIMNNAKKIQFFNLATRLRLEKLYDKALQMYTKLSEQFDEVEPYYGKVLCKYGVQYVGEDLECDIVNLTPVEEDEDYQHACEIATDDEFELLEQEAQMINDFQKSNKKKADAEAKAKAEAEAKAEEEKAKKEREFRGFYQEAKPYDIFVLVSDKDRKAESYKLAKLIYQVLKEDGKAVFFPHIALKDLEDGDPKKEAYLQKALETSKIMILFGGSKEELKFYKVKDRLDAYADLAANDDTKKILPCLDGIAPQDVPAAVKKLKIIDTSKDTFVDALMDEVDKVFKVKVEPLKPEEKYYGKASSALAAGDFEGAIKNIDLCIKSNSKFEGAYLLGILASSNVKTKDKLSSSVENNKYYKMAIEEGDTSVEAVRDEVNEKLYNKAIKMPHNTEAEVKAYVEALTPIKNYKDAQALIDSAYEPIYEPKYQEAIALLNKGITEKFERFINEAVRNLQAIVPYKDSAEKAEEGKAYVEKLNDDLFKDSYEKAKDLYTEAQGTADYAQALKLYKQAAQLFMKVLSYKDARSWNLKCREMEYNYSAMVIFKSEVVEEVKDAVATLTSIRPYKEADTFIAQGNNKIKDLLDPKKQKKKKK